MRNSILAFAFLALLHSLPAWSQPAYLVQDLDSETLIPASSNPQPLLTLAGKVFFAASEPSAGRELWVADGTSQGTQMLADACPGTCDSGPQVLGAAGNLVFFAAISDESGDPWIWRSDGTRRGTYPLTSGGANLHVSNDTIAAATLGKTFFVSACAEGAGCGLWKTDGTEAGTVFLRQLDSFDAAAAAGIVASGNLIFVLTAGEASPVALWTSDGTAGGTVQVAEIGDSAGSLVAAGGRVFFFGDGQDLGRQLWTSDGTAAGTRALTAFPKEPGFRYLKALGNKVYFIADDVVHGAEIWASDGTAAGTRRITEFGYYAPFPSDADAGQIEAVGAKIFFIATDGLSGFKLWTTSGTPESTAPMASICAGDFCDPFELDLRLVRLGNRILFAADDGVHGTEIWSTDGTPAGTVLTRDVCPGACPSYYAGTLVPLLGSAFFLASSPDGLALWRSDGTPAGTRQFARLGAEVVTNFSLAAAGKTVFYPATDAYGTELWASDGTPQGTRPVTDVSRQAAGSRPQDLAALGSQVFFLACQGNAESLWRSAGTPGDVSRVVDTNGGCRSTAAPRTAVSGNLVYFWRSGSFQELWRAGEGGAASQLIELDQYTFTDPTRLVPFQGKIYFVRQPQNDANLGEIWTSDGTPLGTGKAFDLPAGEVVAPDSLVAAGGKLYFNAGPPDLAADLWRSDGTAAGTFRLTASNLNFSDLRVGALGSRVLFFGFKPDSGEASELWRTDGTPFGTAPVREGFRQDYNSLYPTAPLALGNAAYFLAAASDQQGLWRSDGTSAGTFLVKPFLLSDEFGDDLVSPPQVVVSAGRLFFVVDDGVHGGELWTSDGAAAGTALVVDLLPGRSSSQISGLRAAGGKLWFSATDGVHGFELWESDGTAAGTRLVQDVAPLEASSYPAEPTAAGERLFWSADDGLSGRELWALPLAGAAGCQPTAAALCLGGRFKVEAVWRDFAGNAGAGGAVGLTADTGYFWFFRPENVEVVLKVLDARTVNGHFWVFYGALSNVEYTLTVTDTQTGLTRRYFNPSGRFASLADGQAFGPLGASLSAAVASAGPAAVIAAEAETAAAPAPCVASSTRLCLNGGRFAVEASWKASGKSGTAAAVPLTGDTGYFWFFDAANVEVVLKVLDGRAVNGRFWVFAGALSNVEYTLKVTDTATGRSKTYNNPSGRLASFGDTAAF